MATLPNRFVADRFASGSPATRESLLLRLPDHGDDEAWAEFLELYQPLLQKLAIGWGLQQADAAEVVQDTLPAVARSIDGFRRQPRSGAFRAWLTQIARRKLIDHLAQIKRQPSGSGDSRVGRWLNEIPEVSGQQSRWQLAHRRQLLGWAAGRVRREIRPTTWEAFHRTSVMGQSIPQVASDLGISVASVHVSRAG